MAGRLAKLVALLPGASLAPETLSTQETAWLAAAAGTLGRDGRGVHVALGGTEQPQTAPGKVLTLPLTEVQAVRNLGDKPVWASFAITGVPATALPAARSKMRIGRRFFAPDGTDLDLDHLKQNTVFVLLIEGKAEDGQNHTALAVQGLPAGWEIAGRIAAGKDNGMPWLGELTETDAEPAADDRFAAVVSLTGEKPAFRVAVRVRAVTPGEFELPGAELSDMYVPAVFARQNAGRIRISGPE
jgi:alpha-2-macroglobulin